MERDARIDVNRQHADMIVNQMVHERESFARDIAATKTKARILVWVGFLMSAFGGTAFMVTLLKVMNDASAANVPDSAGSALSIGGVPVGIIGLGVGVVGQFVLIAGIILHIVAASRRRQLLLMPDPRQSYGAWR
jgi:hypothetical protein